MPDWIVHMGVAYIICRILYFKYPFFNPANTSLAMIGAILPDIVKLGIVFDHLGIDIWDNILAFHIPFTSLVLAGLVAMFFERKNVFFLFALGACTHFALDMLLINIGEGIYLFFPLSWQMFHIDLLSPDDYVFSFIVLALSFMVFIFGLLTKRRLDKSFKVS